jgi:hypothetical protein
MIRIAISVEGQTEESFCKYVLSPFFLDYNIQIIPIIVTTSKDRCGRKHKGGCINIDRVKNELKKLLPTHDYVTTFYDFYGFDNPPANSADELEKRIFELFNDRKLIPYIQQYEFETLLFSKPEYYEEFFNNDSFAQEMRGIVSSFQDDIEKINDSPSTSPSKRLAKLFKEVGEEYDKVLYGEGIASDIGIEAIRVRAKRFNRWIEKIISLGASNE